MVFSPITRDENEAVMMQKISTDSNLECHSNISENHSLFEALTREEH